MANEPYLSDRFLGCYKAPLKVPQIEPNPKCTVDKYTQSFRDRWNLIKQDPCSKFKFTALNDACCDLGCAVQNCENVCLNPGNWARGQSLYSKEFKFPKSHNDVDDCCPTPCYCADQLPDYCRDSKNSGYCPVEPWTPPCPPMSDCTTYNAYYHPHCVEPRKCRQPETYCPSGEPLEECSITKTDFSRKCPIPNGPANAEVIKHGLWSCSQFCKPFRDITTNEVEYPPKCATRPPKIIPENNLCIPCYYPLKTDTETASQFYCKSNEAEPVHCFHAWLDNENWHKPETEMDKCTTYAHFYRPFTFPPPTKCEVDSPKAIPFCSMNRLCYSCTDTVPNQKTPVELKDNDPWPYVKPCQIRYQDNLMPDPCADFNDDTTYKTDYYAKALCRPNYNFAPINGFVPPITPFNDDTTMKISYPAYSYCQYKNAVGCSGNPCGIKWGLNPCPENVNKCLPRFPSPYGSPLKPFNCQHCQCPCGPFDCRSTYNRDFKFRSQIDLDEQEEEMCRRVNVPQGVTTYRFDFVEQVGKKAARMPPPESKGYRCMNPCSIRNLDSLHRLSYTDFWKTTDPSHIQDLYRAKPSIKKRASKNDCKKDDGCCEDYGDEEPILYQPIIIRQKKKKQKSTCPSPCAPPAHAPCPPDLFEAEESLRRCRGIPYSGRDIRNLAKSALVCDGYEGQ